MTSNFSDRPRNPCKCLVLLLVVLPWARMLSRFARCRCLVTQMSPAGHPDATGYHLFAAFVTGTVGTYEHADSPIATSQGQSHELACFMFHLRMSEIRLERG